MSSLDLPKIVQDASNNSGCLPRFVTSNKTMYKLSVACIPRNAANASDVKCYNLLKVQVPSDKFDCSSITSDWAYIAAQLDANTMVCHASCNKFSGSGTSNSTVPAQHTLKPSSIIKSAPANNDTSNNALQEQQQTTSNATTISYPNYNNIITFAALFIVLMMLFNKR